MGPEGLPPRTKVTWGGGSGHQMDSRVLSGILALLSSPTHAAAFFTAARLLPLKASHLDPPHLSAFGPSAFAALQESLWEALSCPLPQLLGFPHCSGPFSRKGQDLCTALFAGRGGGHGGLSRGQQLPCTSQHQPANPGRCTGGICRLARQAQHHLLRGLLLASLLLRLPKAGVRKESCVPGPLSTVCPSARRQQQRGARIQPFFPLPEERCQGEGPEQIPAAGKRWPQLVGGHHRLRLLNREEEEEEN